jgi:hypothetical protein
MYVSSVKAAEWWPSHRWTCLFLVYPPLVIVAGRLMLYDVLYCPYCRKRVPNRAVVFRGCGRDLG